MKKLIFSTLLISQLESGCADKKENVTADGPKQLTTNQEREDLVNTYSEVPEASAMIRGGDTGMAVYALCQQRFTSQLAVLKKQADALGAKLIVTILSPEIGEAVTASTRLGIPFMLDAAKKNSVEAYDLTSPMAKYTPQQITQMPVDGHWSAAGSKIVADLYEPIIANNKNQHGTKTFADNERPALLGDLDPGQDAALDGGKGIPYQLITNSQGLRMNYALGFPKAKQRILFLGDSQLYSPFLDNGQIFTSLLQEKFADKEIINAGVVGYTLDDHGELLAERAKYSEPDIIILVTNPNDIGDYYFAQRNKMSRSKKAFVPTASEIALYNQLFTAK